MFANINCHTYQKGNNKNLAEYCNKCVIDVHSYFLIKYHPINQSIPLESKFRINNNSLCSSTGMKSDAQNTPKVICEQAIKTSDQYFLSSMPFIRPILDKRRRAVNYVQTTVFNFKNATIPEKKIHDVLSCK